MKQVSCSCGYIASADTAEELLTAVEAHIDANHGLSGADAPQPTPQQRRVASPEIARDLDRSAKTVPVFDEGEER